MHCQIVARSLGFPIDFEAVEQLEEFLPVFVGEQLLPGAQQQIWNTLAAGPRLGFVLYGATAIALHVKGTGSHMRSLTSAVPQLLLPAPSATKLLETVAW